MRDAEGRSAIAYSRTETGRLSRIVVKAKTGKVRDIQREKVRDEQKKFKFYRKNQ